MKATITLQDSIVVSKDVVFQELEGETVVLNLATGMYHGLNDVGTRAWELLQDERALQEIFDMLMEEYDVSAHQLEVDLLRLIQDLRKHRIVQVVAKRQGHDRDIP
jgi:hypothetical protein